MKNLESELTDLLNRHSAENVSNTPDFLLARYLTSCLAAYNDAVAGRDNWSAISPEPSQLEEHQRP